jgi:hypothetical protein
MNVAALIATGVEALNKIATKFPDVLPHAVEFVEAIGSGDARRAARAATSATVSRFWRRSR